MGLTRPERERVIDSRHKIQSAASSLKRVGEKIPDYDSVEECLENVEKSLGAALDPASDS
jgi:hypothetical protein